MMKIDVNWRQGLPKRPPLLNSGFRSLPLWGICFCFFTNSAKNVTLHVLSGSFLCNPMQSAKFSIKCRISYESSSTNGNWMMLIDSEDRKGFSPGISGEYFLLCLDIRQKMRLYMSRVHALYSNPDPLWRHCRALQRYKVATISRLLKIIGLFCKRAL